MSAGRPEGYRPHLDGIRALAVGAVILFHLGYGWIPGGFVGVDVFFVLSGYLITGLLLAEAAAGAGADGPTIALGRFYTRRARRLLPASLVVLLAVIVGADTLLDQVQQQAVGRDVTWSALYGANWRFVSGGVDYFTPGDVPSPVQHFWSLAVEEQFYLVWPLLFLGLWRLSTRRRGVEATGALLAAVLALTTASAVLSVQLVGTNAGYFGTHVRAHQLLAGAALAIAARRWRSRIPTGRGAAVAGTTGALAGLAVLVHLATTIEGSGAYPGVAGLVVTGASLALIAGLDLAPPTFLAGAVGHAAPAAVGRLSYSLYLWHWPVIVFAPVLAEVHGAPLLANRAVIAAATVALAGASYLLVERPVRFRLVPTAPKPAVVGVGLALSVLVAAVAVPFLQPRQPYAETALAAADDLAPTGPCPYAGSDWGPGRDAEPCVYRRGGATTIAVVGDSHAQMWQPAIDRLAAEHDLTVVVATRRGCPVNDLTLRSFDDQGAPFTDYPCTTWRRTVYERLVERYDPAVIYAQTRSHDWSLLDTRDGGEDGTVAPDDPGHREMWTEAWDPSLDLLTAGTGRVVLAETLPEMPFAVPACLAEHGPGDGRCDVPIEADEVVGPYNDAMAAAVAGRDDVTVVDPAEVVCPDGTCPALIDGEIVHRDDDHLTASFAASAADDLEALLRRAGIGFDER